MSGNEGDLLQTSGSSLHAADRENENTVLVSSSRCASSAPECVPLSKLRRFHVAQGNSDSEEESKLGAALSGAIEYRDDTLSSHSRECTGDQSFADVLFIAGTTLPRNGLSVRAALRMFH